MEPLRVVGVTVHVNVKAVLGRQSEGSLIRGFDSLALTLTLGLSTVGLTDLRIIGTLPLIAGNVSAVAYMR